MNELNLKIVPKLTGEDAKVRFRKFSKYLEKCPNNITSPIFILGDVRRV